MSDYVIVFIRGFAAFVTLLILVRLIGRKQMSQMTFTDYIVGAALGSLSATFTVSKTINIPLGIIAVGVWCGMNILTSYLSLKNLRIRKLVVGETLLVIEKGKVNDRNMARANYSINDLLMQLREKDVFDISKVDYALLETNGQLSILKKPEYNNLTPKDMNIQPTPQGLMTELVIDGRILGGQLVKLKKNETWLRGELGKQGIQDLNKVIFAGLLSNGQLYAAKRIE